MSKNAAEASVAVRHFTLSLPCFSLQISHLHQLHVQLFNTVTADRETYHMQLGACGERREATRVVSPPLLLSSAFAVWKSNARHEWKNSIKRFSKVAVKQDDVRKRTHSAKKTNSRCEIIRQTSAGASHFVIYLTLKSHRRLQRKEKKKREKTEQQVEGWTGEQFVLFKMPLCLSMKWTLRRIKNNISGTKQQTTAVELLLRN